MSYIFRLHKEGNNALTDWGNSSKYGTNVIDQIKDPNGESAKREITSIPSPFARIDLVKTAFGKVAAMGIEGSTIHHKMVSDAFDIGQLFFEYDKFANQLEIIVWDKENDMDELLNSPYIEHQQLGKTYDIFFKQDGAMYNFAQMDRMYLLNYKNGPEITNIIGATSPATLFFTSANDLSYVGNAVRFGNDRPFDDEYTPLYKRDLEYQKFWYLLRITNRQFPQLFPEVNRYLDENFNRLDAAKQRIIRALDVNELNNYTDIAVGSAGNLVYVINSMPMKQKTQDATSIERSGFALAESDYRIDGKKPLILPVDTYTKQTLYTLEAWDRNTSVPYYDPAPIQERTLPDDGSKYPYLTISDFFTDTIVRMPYEINTEKFFDGNIDKAGGNSYLLPLTDLFFQCFTVEKLTGILKNGKKMFELKNLAGGGVKAILRIPVAGDVIEYSRIYFEAGANVGETKNTNDGVLIENAIGLGIMPLIRFPEKVKKHYRIAMFDKGERNDAILTCVDGNKIVETKQVVRAKKDLAGRGCSHESYIVEENFDRIQVKVGNVVEGYIVPKFKKDDEGNTEYTFAVDFGTTNTHIEYCVGENHKSPFPFDIKANERQLHKLHTLYTDPDIRMGFVQEFIPDTIGDNDMYSFPMRTVFAQHKNIKYEQSPMPLADGHIPFLYEKDFTPMWNDIKTELKWGGAHERLLEMHLETIFILMRNKVALNGGNLSATKVVWFYPASMTEAKVNQFKKNWKSAYGKYFGENTKNIISISESKAPYIHFVETQGAKPEVVTIDIGGGTTDVFVVEGEEDRMLLSFRFASNAIFGDGYNSNPSKNGFVRKYKKQFEEILKNNKLEELSQALSQIEAQNKSSDIIAFLFSLIGDKVKNNAELNFLQKLSNDDRLRYVFIIFYASILYFIAKSMKAKGLKKPKTIAFSGNGAHSLRIVSDEKEMIERFAKLIFDGVYSDNKGTIEVMMEKNPKIATCKGGIAKPESQEYETIDNIKTILVGNDFDNFSNKKLTYVDITEDIQNAVVTSIKEFFKFLFDLHKNNNDFLSNKLGADPAVFNQIKEFCLGEEGEQLLETSMFKGLKNKRAEVNDDTKLEETLFFYPLVGVLHDLALKISEM